MRLSARDLEARVVTVPGTIRPVRLSFGGFSFRLDPGEAIGLATQLADAVDEIRNTEGETPDE